MRGRCSARRPTQAFFVKCDEETNPPEVIEAGQVICEIGIAPVKPAEFVIFRLSQFSRRRGRLVESRAAQKGTTETMASATRKHAATNHFRLQIGGARGDRARSREATGLDSEHEIIEQKRSTANGNASRSRRSPATSSASTSSSSAAIDSDKTLVEVAQA